MDKSFKVALVGNPNCGKTSLFNALTGLRQKVGNYPGVTVDKKTGYCKLGDGVTAELIDLPGTYSLYPRSMDEFITFEILLNESSPLHPDLVVLVIDASNLKRNLLLASQIMDLKIPVLIAFNMQDVAERRGLKTDIAKLAEELGVNVVPINARKGKGLSMLREKMDINLTVRRDLFFDARAVAPDALDELKQVLETENDYRALQVALNYERLDHLDEKTKAAIEYIHSKYPLNRGAIQGKEILARYKKIDELITQYVKRDITVRHHEINTRLDQVLTHPVYGYLIFVTVLFLIFQAIFSWSEYPMLLIENFFAYTTDWLTDVLPQGWLTSLLVEGIIAGLGGIVIFIPQIAFLFAFITLLEETGYMARVSFMMDGMMRKVGLNGKSVVPMMSGVACAVPAIMATRNIENWKDRLITILVTPLMSCSARIPVYTLLIALFVPSVYVMGVFNLQGLVMMLMYLLGTVAAVLVALVLNVIIKTTEKSYFIMELPDYKSPRIGNILFTMYEKSKIFVVEAGKIIIVISIILWLMASYGPGDSMQRVEEQYSAEQYREQYSELELENKIESEKLKTSYAGRFGKLLEPAIEPLGFDWKIGIALITSFAAREVFVGTMATIYSLGSDEDDTQTLKEQLLKDTNPETGEKTYTTATAISLMVFYAFALQCMSTLAIVRRETRSWKWPIIQFVYMAVLAYAGSFAAYHLFS